tara:strand:- start:19 stop:744 length:726 start_codon:yes stop_codon:yes gene_type:complete
MEFETYADVIDSYNLDNQGYSTLTDYIKGNNIKIKEIEMDPIGDLEKILREGKRPMEEKGIMMAGYLDPMSEKNDMAMELFGKQLKDLTDEELELLDEEIDRLRSKFMADGGRINLQMGTEKEGIMQMASGNMDIKIEEVVKEFIKRKKRRPRSLDEIKEFYFKEMTSRGGPTSKDNVSLAQYEPGKYSADDIEMYEQYKYDMNEQRPGMPIIDIDEFLRMEEGQARAGVAGGGLPAILGV